MEGVIKRLDKIARKHDCKSEAIEISLILIDKINNCRLLITFNSNIPIDICHFFVKFFFLK